MRLRKDPDAEIKLNESEFSIKDYPITLKKDNILELGMGKGEMITTLASQNPDTFFIGVEKYATVAWKAAKKAEELQLKNFKISLLNIDDLSENFDGSIDVIWLTFSDPWPKKRHAKRRLTHIDYLNKYRKIISKDGVIKFKTDNDPLFNWTIEHLEENNIKILKKTNDFHSSELSEGNVMTGYEKKWSESGKKINYMEFSLS